MIYEFNFHIEKVGGRSVDETIEIVNNYVKSVLSSSNYFVTSQKCETGYDEEDYKNELITVRIQYYIMSLN